MCTKPIRHHPSRPPVIAPVPFAHHFFEHLLRDCAGTQPYRTNHDLTFDTLVSEKPRNIIRIAYFDTWLRDVFSFSTRPPTYRIAATVKEMTSDEHRKKKDSGMNPRKRQKQEKR
mmetsp:Transcript_62142/g.92136  ORF Transcript_62142/g.92136 Transcript_62142/m.92136 type:complete len:115 (-) Transcript_62142:46-390(-)